LESIGGSDGIGFGLTHLMQRRQAGELPEQILDLHFQQLMKDPVATIEKLYEQMGRTLHAEHADAIRQYITDKPKGKFGTHKYTPEEWGFDAQKTREEMLPYTDYYGIELES